MFNMLLIILAASAMSLAYASFSVLHMLLLEQWTNYLYFTAKILKRRTPLGKMTSDRRHLLENFGDLACLTFPPMFVLAYHIVPKVLENGLDAIDFSIRPVDISLSVIGIYICFDVFYYTVHRALHEIPFLYQTIHKRHHEDVPVHLFLTGKAEYIENLLAVSPGVTAWIVLTLTLSPTLNLWTLLLPSLTLIMEFNTGHAGYLDHWLLYIMSPLQYIVKVLPTARWVAKEHEEHHLRLRKNYAPIFNLLDRIGGSHSVPGDEKFSTADVVEKMSLGKIRKEE